MDFQWYEFEIVDKKDQWTRVLDKGECNLKDKVFRLQRQAFDFIECKAQYQYKIRNTTTMSYNMAVTKLGRNLYMCEAENFKGDHDDRPWMLIRVRKHVVRVPTHIAEEHFKRLQPKGE